MMEYAIGYPKLPFYPTRRVPSESAIPHAALQNASHLARQTYTYASTVSRCSSPKTRLSEVVPQSWRERVTRQLTPLFLWPFIPTFSKVYSRIDGRTHGDGAKSITVIARNATNTAAVPRVAITGRIALNAASAHPSCLCSLRARFFFRAAVMDGWRQGGRGVRTYVAVASAGSGACAIAC